MQKRLFLRLLPLQSLLLLLSGLQGCTRGTSTPPATTNTSSAAVPGAVSASFRLEEVAKARGLDFQHTIGTRTPITIVEAMGSGCAFLDFDNDGWLDVFLVNAGQDFMQPRQTPGCKLFHNRGDGTFEEATASSGIVVDGYAMGCCVGDYDNDGLPDLFVSGYGHNWLFRNTGQGHFEDTTQRAGLLRRPGAWGMGCAFVDVNRDGRLDLYVANYVKYDPNISLCRSANVLHGCTPNQYQTQANELYINQGNGRFNEQAVALGADNPTGAGLGVVVCDFDNDGWPDIFVANDGTPNALLHNQKGRFKDVAQVAGVAYGEDGVMRAGMGVDAGDYDGDGLFDIVVTNFQHEPNSLYHNLGKMAFEDASYRDGVGTPALGSLKFGVIFADLDTDGRPDLYVGNGHVYDNVSAFDDTATFEQQDQIFLNQGGKYTELPASGGAFPMLKSVSRSIASGDFNNDGRPDLLINSLGRPVRLLENHAAKPGEWIGLRLQGTHSNRSALGTRVELRTASGLQVREVHGGGSYLAQSDLRVLFALGPNAPATPPALHIRWPDGKTQSYTPSRFNTYLTVKEPDTKTLARKP